MSKSCTCNIHCNNHVSNKFPFTVNKFNSIQFNSIQFNMFCRCDRIVARFLVWGGGARLPNVPKNILIHVICASELQKYIFRSQNTSSYMYTINAVSFYYFIWHGDIYDYTLTIPLRKIYKYACILYNKCSFLLLLVVWHYVKKTAVCRQNTNIVKIYVHNYASERA